MGHFRIRHEKGKTQMSFKPFDGRKRHSLYKATCTAQGLTGDSTFSTHQAFHLRNAVSAAERVEEEKLDSRTFCKPTLCSKRCGDKLDTTAQSLAEVPNNVFSSMRRSTKEAFQLPLNGEAASFLLSHAAFPPPFQTPCPYSSRNHVLPGTVSRELKLHRDR